MPTPTYDPIIKRGRTFQRSLTLKVDATTPFDLTGCQILSQLRRNVDAEEKVDFVCTIDNDPTTGRFTWVMAFGVTQDLDVRDYVYDMVLVLSDDTRQDILEGRPRVVNGATIIP